MSSQKRIHGIDSLRAVAMLLGIFLHASIAYKAKPQGNWMHDGQYNSWWFNLLYFSIHSFRMPLFFVVGGFFCRLLYYKVGEKAFILHRWKRVAVPFILALILIVPFSLIPYNMYILVYREGVPEGDALSQALRSLFRFSGLAHLWFLYDLLIFYVVTMVILHISRIPFLAPGAAGVSAWWAKARLNRPFALLLVVVPLWLCLLPGKELFPVTDTHVIPRRINNLFYYGFLFFAGWMLHKRSDVFRVLTGAYRMLLYPGIVLLCVLFYLEWNEFMSLGMAEAAFIKLGAAFEVTLLILGVMGFFLRHFDNESQFWKYVSDASYWVYLVHLVIVTALQFAFLDSRVPGVLRFPLILLLTVPITFLSYHWLVRYTFIGTYLHGPRKRNRKITSPFNATFKNG